MMYMDKKQIEKSVKEILIAIGENPEREGLKKTPERVARMYGEILSGIEKNPEKELEVYYTEEEHEEIVLVKDISFYSVCEHHLLPFFGKVHIGYIPKKDKLLGISKIARLVDVISKRLQLQERITKQLADIIMKKISPYGVMVVIEAEHLCMTMRGVKKPGTKIVTSAIRGIFSKDAKARAEALSLITGIG
ncbi:MAG: GTP cyclohydrolase I FolE [Elusimicrobia bacterium CG06_land_8_20_14_3_00_38_11]|nr:MAG: GTP cyclohydrolase I FolE [Elusimicrobia bacterium CG06_land_8_20_14_3_00_38_11]